MNKAPEDDTDTATTLVTDQCPSCDAVREGLYCSVCGERRIRADDRRLRALYSTVSSTILDADGRLPRSLVALVFRPGRLTFDWMRGRRRPWLGPVPLYLLINLLIFLAPPLSDFNLSLREQTVYQLWSETAARLVEARIASRNSTFAMEAKRYGDVSSEVGKLLLIWHVPFLALATALVCRAQRHYAADHLVWSLHQFSVFLILIFTAAWTVGPLLQSFVPSAVAANVLSFTWRGLLLVFLAHSVLAAHKAFSPSRWRLVALVPCLLIALLLGPASYRLVQFLIAFALS
ncbi:MAG: DUF3667 domain-containing protein [Pseudomonadota bacterium]